jgi:hypothetical protein
MPQVPLGEGSIVGALHEFRAGDGYEQIEMGGTGLVPTGDQTGDRTGRSVRTEH